MGHLLGDLAAICGIWFTLQFCLFSSQAAKHLWPNRNYFIFEGYVNGWHIHYWGFSGLHHGVTFTCLKMVFLIFLLLAGLLQFTSKCLHVYWRHEVLLQQTELVGKALAESGKAGHLFQLCHWLTMLLWEEFLAFLVLWFLTCKDQKDLIQVNSLI